MSGAAALNPEAIITSLEAAEKPSDEQREQLLRLAVTALQDLPLESEEALAPTEPELATSAAPAESIVPQKGTLVTQTIASLQRKIRSEKFGLAKYRITSYLSVCRDP